MAEKALQAGYRSICLLTGNPDYSSEKDFCRGFLTMMEGSTCQVIQIWTDSFRKYQNIMQIFNGTLPQAFFISNYGFAESAKDMCTTFYGKEEGSPDIYTVAPLFTIPENDFIKYEMNYRQLGKRAAKMLIRKAEESGAEESTAQESATEENTASEKIPDNVGTEGHANWMIPGDGFQNWFVNIRKPESTQPLNIVTLDSLEAYIMKTFSRLFTQKTGIDVNVCILSYDEIYEAFNSLDETSRFDILRLDVTWLSWFAQKLLRPLSEIDENIENSLGQYVEGVPEHYCRVHGQIYALPVTPSVQILYYRKDLFESPICKRTYFEQFHEELQPPKTFEEYNRIAAFFTRDLTPSSPVPYGSTITLGSTGVAGSEFLARLFAIQENLYGADGQIHLDSLQCQQALAELVQLRRCTSPEYCGWWTQTARRFAEGNFAMSILYSNYHLPVKNRTAADDGIRHIRTPVVFCRGFILRLCFNIGIFIDEMIANILFQEIHIRLKISRNACADGIPVAVIFIAVDFQRMDKADDNILYQTVSAFGDNLIQQIDEQRSGDNINPQGGRIGFRLLRLFLEALQLIVRIHLQNAEFG